MSPLDLSSVGIKDFEFFRAEYKEKTEAIIEWALDHERFDDSFVLEMDQKLADGEDLTEGQMKAIDNIVERFNIDV